MRKEVSRQVQKVYGKRGRCNQREADVLGVTELCEWQSGRLKSQTFLLRTERHPVDEIVEASPGPGCRVEVLMAPLWNKSSQAHIGSFIC